MQAVHLHYRRVTMVRPGIGKSYSWPESNTPAKENSIVWQKVLNFGPYNNVLGEEAIRHARSYALEAEGNLAKVYLGLGNIDQAKRQLDICIQINPKDCWSYIMLGNIYTKQERNLDVAEFYYECGLEHCPDDGMLLNNFANLMMEKGNFSFTHIPTSALPCCTG